MIKPTIEIKPFKVQVTPEQSEEIQELVRPAHRHLSYNMYPFLYIRYNTSVGGTANEKSFKHNKTELLHPNEAIARVKEAIAAAEPEEWYDLVEVSYDTADILAYRGAGTHSTHKIHKHGGELSTVIKWERGGANETPCTKEAYYALLKREGMYLHDLTADHRVPWKDMHPDNQAEILALPQGSVQELDDGSTQWIASVCESDDIHMEDWCEYRQKPAPTLRPMTRKEVLQWAVGTKSVWWTVRNRGSRPKPPQSYAYNNSLEEYERSHVDSLNDDGTGGDWSKFEVEV